jgi:hypothetical protein
MHRLLPTLVIMRNQRDLDRTYSQNRESLPQSNRDKRDRHDAQTLHHAPNVYSVPVVEVIKRSGICSRVT